jgi:hypothetical protein
LTLPQNYITNGSTPNKQTIKKRELHLISKAIKKSRFTEV